MGFPPLHWLALVLAALLGLTSTGEARLAVVNGNFSDLTGLTPGDDGWYSGLPQGWSGSGDAYAVNGKYGATPPPLQSLPAGPPEPAGRHPGKDGRCRADI